MDKLRHLEADILLPASSDNTVFHIIANQALIIFYTFVTSEKIDDDFRSLALAYKDYVGSCPYVYSHNESSGCPTYFFLSTSAALYVDLWACHEAGPLFAKECGAGLRK